MAVTITGLTDADLRVFANIPLGETMYTMGQVEARLGSITGTVAEYIASAVSTAWKAGGSKTASGLLAKTGNAYDLLISGNEGKVYQLSEDLDVDSTTASVFVEPSGTHIEAGTDVAVINTAASGQTPVYKFNALAVTDSSVVKSVNGNTPTNGAVTIPNAVASGQTGAKSGLMTAADKYKLDTISTGAEVNQNAFSTVNAGTFSINASLKTDSFTISGGTGISVGKSGNDTVLISAVLSSGYGAVSLYNDNSGNGVFSTAGDECDTFTMYAGDYVTFSSVSGTGAPQINVSIPAAGTNSGESGLMTPSQVTKLNGISAGAEVNQNAFSKVAVAGQTTVEADAKTDTLNLAAGTGISITTNSSTDTVTVGVTDSVVTKVRFNGTEYSADNGVADIGSAVTDVRVGGSSVVGSCGVAEITIPVTDVQAAGVSIVSSGIASIPVTDVKVGGSSVLSCGVAEITLPVTDVKVGGATIVSCGVAEIAFPVTEVQIAGTSILHCGLANIPMASVVSSGSTFNHTCGVVNLAGSVDDSLSNAVPTLSLLKTDFVSGKTLHDNLVSCGIGSPSSGSYLSGTLYALIAALHASDNRSEAG